MRGCIGSINISPIERGGNSQDNSQDVSPHMVNTINTTTPSHSLFSNFSTPFKSPAVLDEQDTYTPEITADGYLPLSTLNLSKLQEGVTGTYYMV